MRRATLSAAVLVAFALATVAYVPVVSAADGEGETDEASEQTQQQIPVHPLTNIPASSPDLRTNFILPDVASNVLSIGEIATIVVGIQNNGNANYNITAIFGSLNSPFNSKMFIQNFTGRAYGRVIESGSEATFEYRFLPSAELEPIDLQAAFTVFYEDEESVYATTFFNQTITFEDKSSPFDIRGTVKLIVLVGAIATIIYKLVEGNSTKKPARKAKFTVVDTPAVSGEFAAEFLAKINKSKPTNGNKSD